MSAASPDRYRAFGGSGITYDLGLERKMAMVPGEDLHINFDADAAKMEMVVSGEANVLAGEYMLVLGAMSEGVDYQVPQVELQR